MALCVKKTNQLYGDVSIPGSKSYTHRALIIASLGGSSQIRNPLVSSDTLATKKACEALGAEITDRGGDWIVRGVEGEINFRKDTIDVSNSGTTLRLFTALAALSGKHIRLLGDSSINSRPMKPLLDALSGWATIESDGGYPPLRLKNKRGAFGDEKIRIRGDVSSQFISALLIVAPLVGLEIEIIGVLKSRPYVEMTLELMNKAGMRVEVFDKGFFVEKQAYGGYDYTVPGDYSSAANILAPAAFIESDVVLRNLYQNDSQGDKKILDVLEQMGAEIKRGEDYVRIRKAESLVAVDFDAQNTPDIVLPLVAVACFAKDISFFRNIEHLRFKESNRLDACNEFSKLGASVRVLKDSVQVMGSSKIKAANMQGFDDHRVVMALAAAALNAVDGISRIDSAAMLNVSFPNYIEVMNSLGADLWLEDE